jgi:cytochrome bd ubiquinol oxidase subunit II
MHLDVWPLIFVLAGLVLYVVLGGADFGAGFWQLFAGRGPHANRIRDHAHHSMGPVWEANHVWLIFVLTVTWTAYPRVFESLASTLCIPLFIAGIGIVLRGAAYAMRAGVDSDREVRTVDAIFGVSSILTPFALGAAVGGLASLRVPTGNAAGDLVTSWLNATSITVGILAVAVSAYLAAVYLAADAVRHGDDELAVAFRRRALAAGAVGGLAAAAGIVVLRFDAHRLFHRLVWGPGTPAVVVSVLAGVATLALVARRRFEPARYTAALAVAAVVAGWALGQNPLLLRDLTVSQAAASRSTLIAVIVAVVAGGVLLFPSLALLFRLTLGGRLGQGPVADEAPVAPPGALGSPRLALRLAGALLIVGVGLTTVADGPWAHGFGVAALLGFVVAGVIAVGPAGFAAAGDDRV